MADVINLRQIRKRKARLDKERDAAANRALHGRTKAEKQAGRAERLRAASTLDAHLRERPDEKA
jgi:hypothetical protein